MRAARARVPPVLTQVLFALAAIGVVACGAGGLAAVFLGNSAAATVPLVVFPGEEAAKPAALLPFTSEVQAVAITPDGRRLMLGDVLHNAVAIVNLSTRRVSAVLDAGGTGPRSIAVTPNGRKALAANWGTHSDADNTVTIIDLTDETVITTLAVGARPFAIAITPDGQRAFVANAGADTLSVIDLDTNVVVNTIATGAEPVALAISRDGARLFIVCRGSNQVQVLDLGNDTVVHTEAVGNAPTGIAIHPGGSKIYVTNRDSNTVTALDAADGSTLTTLAVEAGPMAVVSSPEGARVFVASAFGGAADDLCGVEGTATRNQVTVIDATTDTVLPGRISVGDAPLALVVTDRGPKLYAASACEDPATGTGSLSHLALGATTGSSDATAEVLSLPARATGLALGPNSGELYVAHPQAVSVVDVGRDQLRGEAIPALGAGPTRLAITPDGRKLYATNSGGDSVAVIDTDPAGVTDNVLGSVAVGQRPSALAITPAGDTVVVTNAGSSRTPDNRVSLIAVTPAGQIDTAAETFVLRDQNNPNSIARGPVSVGLTPDGTQAFIAAFGDFYPNTRAAGAIVARVDLATRQVHNFVNCGEWPLAASLDAGAALNEGTGVVAPGAASDSVLYVSDFFANQVLRGTPASGCLFASLGDLDGPVGMAFAEHRTYAGNYRPAHSAGSDRSALIEIAPSGDQASIALAGVGAGRVAVTPDGQTAYLLHSGDRATRCGPGGNRFCSVGNSVSLAQLPLATATTQNLTVGRRPLDIAFTPDLPGVPQRAFISNYFDGTVTVIEPWTADGSATPQVVATLAVGRGPIGVVVNAQGTRAYVANSISNDITVIDIDAQTPSSVVDTITVTP